MEKNITMIVKRIDPIKINNQLMKVIGQENIFMDFVDKNKWYILLVIMIIMIILYLIKKYR